jgi:hypothetical protein
MLLWTVAYQLPFPESVLRLILVEEINTVVPYFPPEALNAGAEIPTDNSEIPATPPEKPLPL